MGSQNPVCKVKSSWLVSSGALPDFHPSLPLPLWLPQPQIGHVSLGKSALRASAFQVSLGLDFLGEPSTWVGGLSLVSAALFLTKMSTSSLMGQGCI